jgi:oligopeptide/dipeptide ABC transporter ATP-binding protein
VTVVLQVEDLTVNYGSSVGASSVTFSLGAGRVLALIGETGSGKSSTALAIARLLPPSTDVSGRITIEGVDVSIFTPEAFRPIRGSKVGFIPQDAMASLNPVMTVGAQIEELYRLRGLSASEAERRTLAALRRVWIQDAGAVARMYPHQLSGGMRQRVMIAIALALDPPLLIADEPTTALDVSTQAEILRLVDHLRQELGLAVLWITHDMGVVAELADNVAVMYAGRLVEQAPSADLFVSPHHPYTSGLLQTLYSLRSGDVGERLHQIDGQPPTTFVPGCPFHPRCSLATSVCLEINPALDGAGEHRVACHHPLVGSEALIVR